MNRQFHNKRQTSKVTDKQVRVGKLFDWAKNFTGHMFNIKLKEKSCKMSFKAVPVKIQKIQRPKTDKRRGGEWGILNA